MEKPKDNCKVIAVYSMAGAHGKTEYAINFAAALASAAKTRVMLIDMTMPSGNILKKLLLDSPVDGNTVVKSDIGIDVLTVENIREQELDKIKNDYKYVVLDCPSDTIDSVRGIFLLSSTVHFFVDATEDYLKRAYVFLEDLLDNSFESVHRKIKIVANRIDVFDKLSIEDITWLIRRDVWAIVPEGGILEMLVDSKGVPIVLNLSESLYAKAVSRIAKAESGKLLGLALGSGAAFGLAHIGVLRVLEQNQITVDIVSGSSIGALIASLWGIGLSSDQIEQIAKRLKNKLNIMRLIDFTMPVSGILAGRRLKIFLKSILGQKTFEDLKIPVKIMVYDLANRETLVIEKGQLVDAVYMSIAIPGIFKPKVGQDRVIIDGGISDPVPVDVLLKQGVEKIIAVNVLPSPRDIYERNIALKKKIEKEKSLMPQSPFYIKAGLLVKDFLRRVFTPNIFDVIMTSMLSMEYVLAENSCSKADVALHPVLADATSVDFHRAKSFIQRGEEEAMLHIEEIKALAYR